MDEQTAALVAQVRKVRTLQIKYYRTRDREILIQSKQAEAILDAMVGRFPPTPADPKEGGQ